MDLAALVTTTDAVAATSARSGKITLLADLLATAGADGTAPDEITPDEMEIAVGLIAGDPRQGRIGVGWATVAALDVPPAAEPSHTIADLDALLTAVAAATGSGSRARRAELLRTFLAAATAAETDFVRRLLVGELRQGANEGVATEAVARATGVPAAVLRRAVMLCGDLRVAAGIAASQGRPGLEAVRLEVGRPILPMLASTAASVTDAVDELGDVAVEWKLDGIRVQAHKVGATVRLWSRNLNELTDRMPEVAAVVADLPADSAVLDGEVLGIDERGRPIDFQDTVATTSSVTPFFFDLLHLDGADLLDAPFRQRRALLSALAAEHQVPGSEVTHPAEGEQVLADALAAGHEGVVVKDLNAPYQAGRRGKTWRKVKPVHTLDLVVLAVEHGSGRRTGTLSNIHLGARGTDGFVMVGKTFKGMTDAMLAWQTERFAELAVADDGRVVQVRPEQVVEIAVDGVQRSTRYPGGVALRFARVVRYRSDKNATETDSIETVQRLRR